MFLDRQGISELGIEIYRRRCALTHSAAKKISLMRSILAFLCSAWILQESDTCDGPHRLRELILLDAFCVEFVSSAIVWMCQFRFFRKERKGKKMLILASFNLKLAAMWVKDSVEIHWALPAGGLNPLAVD